MRTLTDEMRLLPANVAQMVKMRPLKAEMRRLPADVAAGRNEAAASRCGAGQNEAAKGRDEPAAG